MGELTILGQQVRTPQKTLETFAAPELVQEVTMESEEVTALCPVTGQPDWYTIAITYQPRALCVESKSLKLYLWSFREEGHFCEQLAHRICEDFAAACLPSWCEVVATMRPRGGVVISATARREA